jgi:uncharacterized phage protein (TIGR02218 family)
MLQIAAAHEPMRDARSFGLHRCWRVKALHAVSTNLIWRFTDAQHEIRIYEEDLGTYSTYSPAQIVFGQSIRRQTGMRANSSELHVSLGLSGGLDYTHIERGLLDGAQVTEYHVSAARPWVGSLARYRWTVADAEHGGGIALLTLSGISARFAESVGEEITTRCQNQFADALCNSASVISGDANFGFRQYLVGLYPGGNTRRVMRIREGTDAFPAASLTDADWWAYGIIRFTDGDSADVIAAIESNEQPFDTGLGYDAVDIVLATPLAFAPAQGDAVTMRVGCQRTHAACKAKFGNLDQFRGDRDIPGSDAQQTTPGAR